MTEPGPSSVEYWRGLTAINPEDVETVRAGKYVLRGAIRCVDSDMLLNRSLVELKLQISQIGGSNPKYCRLVLQNNDSVCRGAETTVEERLAGLLLHSQNLEGLVGVNLIYVGGVRRGVQRMSVNYLSTGLFEAVIQNRKVVFCKMEQPTGVAEWGG